MAEQPGLKAPYVAFSTFLTTLAKLKEHSVPARLDRSAFHGMSGGQIAEVRPTYRFLGLSDEADQPTKRLHELVDAFQTDAWQSVFAATVEASYRELIGELDLKTATMMTLTEQFRSKTQATGQTLEKGVRFYLSALDAIGVAYSPHIKARRQAVGAGPRRAPRRSPRKQEPDPDAAAPSSGAVEDRIDTAAKGMIRFPAPIPEKDPATIIVPNDMTLDEWSMVDQYVRAYIGIREKNRGR